MFCGWAAMAMRNAVESRYVPESQILARSAVAPATMFKIEREQP